MILSKSLNSPTCFFVCVTGPLICQLGFLFVLRTLEIVNLAFFRVADSSRTVWEGFRMDKNTGKREVGEFKGTQPKEKTKLANQRARYTKKTKLANPSFLSKSSVL